MALDVKFRVHGSSLDREYGKFDLAHRVMDVIDPDGRTGYLLAVRIVDGHLLIAWDNSIMRSWIPSDQVQVIG